MKIYTVKSEHFVILFLTKSLKFEVFLIHLGSRILVNKCSAQRTYYQTKYSSVYGLPNPAPAVEAAPAPVPTGALPPGPPPGPGGAAPGAGP